ncbi:periplasmic chaperone for outer membrane proteins Skp [Chitinophaga costaii]|uniref:Periplasmic chaperone for outer membrane proteins Skp n=1 Tax=Chitinophaga costaii TaxID=1335309 RepID=A0A1C4F6K4_9BACT|nr:OmpH family outer membrane protein [Chitinophaga costaii]PUZ21264.1 OmpH family outer membrane protein [Chitinophaga costaii]SCC51263.1 periplasmic chaperone for outer membrane proteins Skp [Chitinophaga costaii]
MKKYAMIAVVAVAGLTSTAVKAQSKVGYINAQAVIEAMPEAKKATDSLQLYQESLEKDGKSLVDEYTAKTKDFNDKAASMTDNMKDLKAREIQDIQKRIEDYRQSAEQKIDQRRSELLKPIYDKARKAIEDASKEKGYTYVIDGSSGILLVSPPGDDLMPAVKVKLGIK